MGTLAPIVCIYSLVCERRAENVLADTDPVGACLSFFIFFIFLRLLLMYLSKVAAHSLVGGKQSFRMSQ